MSKTYVKLKNVGDAATFTVVRCAPGTGTYPDVEFEDSEGRVYPVPKASADRQLERLGIAEYRDAEGKAITISRSENKKAPDKAFWNIEWAAALGNGGGKAGASNGAKGADSQPNAPTGQAPAPQPEKPSALYERVTDYVLASIVPRYNKAGIVVTDRGVAAIVATLFIAANDRA